MIIPSGLISLWFGAIVDIPAGWVICDGNNGTPDLRDNFVIGAGAAYAVDDTGGASTHDHDFTTDGHFHSMAAGSILAAGAQFDSDTDTKTDTGTTDPGNSLPPYHALAYIMKT